MTIYDYSDETAVKLLGTKYRRTDYSSAELADAHQQIGQFMAYKMLSEFELEEFDIPHPLGTKTGFKLEKNIIIVCLMRAGLFYSIGVRSVFQNARFMLVNPKRDIGLADESILDVIDENSKVIVLDAVINTGETMIPFVDQLEKRKPKKVILSTIVIPEKTIELLEEKYSEHNIYIFRSSKDSYRASGANDTGNRLFSTFDIE